MVTKRPVYTLLCDYMFDANGKQSFMGIFTNIGIRDLAQPYPVFYAVSCVEVTPEDTTFRMRLVDWDDTWEKTVQQFEVDFDQERRDGPLPDVQAVILGTQVPMIQFPHYGGYRLEVLEGDTVVHWVNFTVSPRKEEQK